MKKLVPQNVKDLFKKLIESHSSTKDVADGLGIGLFVAFLPIVGIQMYVSLLLTRFFKKNSIVAILAAWITNPLTVVPIYLFNLWVGNFIYPNSVSWEYLRDVIEEMNWRSMLMAGTDIVVPLWIGSVIVGTVIGFAGQRLCLRYYDRVRERFSKKGEHESTS